MAGLIGFVLLIRMSQMGGSLVFDHGLGIPTARLRAIGEEREAEHHEHGVAEDHKREPAATPASSGPAETDSANGMRAPARHPAHEHN